MPKRQSGNKKGKQSNFAKLSIFQPNKYKFKKTCPLSTKGAPAVGVVKLVPQTSPKKPLSALVNPPFCDPKYLI